MEVTPRSSLAISSESHNNLLHVSQPPTTEALPLVLYKNYWLFPHHASNVMMLQDSFQARHDDTILATNPKCGTTWLKALAFAITNRSRYNISDPQHPLLTRHTHEVVPFIEIPLDDKELTYVDTLASPRVLATHMPVSLLPKSVADHGCRIVYLCRDPKDAFVSGWHFGNQVNLGSGAVDLDTAFNMFCDGFWPSGPFWDHCLEYWKESIARPDKVLFLKYEKMMLEPVKSVKRLAMFLGVPFTSEEENHGVPEEVVRLCSFEMLSGVQANRMEEIVDGNLIIQKSTFFRRGKIGDWVNHMSEKMGRELDMIVGEKLKGSGLVF